jgi:hypothetical protein
MFTKSEKYPGFNSVGRRAFLRTAGLLPAAAMTVANAQAKGTPNQQRLSGREGDSQALRNAVDFGDQFVLWQSPYGSADPVKCPYRPPTDSYQGGLLQSIEPAARALYRLYECTNVEDYKVAADRYATFFMNVIHDPLTPYVNTITLDGKTKSLFCVAWEYGVALWCYQLFRLHNHREDPFELKAYAIYRWLQVHRRPEGYFGVGYPCGKFPDCQFTSDLSEVGIGLVRFYEVSHHKPARDDALGLLKFFLTEWEQGSGRGAWSSRLGCWLVGPWPGTRAEHFTNQQYNSAAWGWSAYEGALYLAWLRPYVQDPQIRADLEDKCVKAFRWCYDACQFEDGAHGMFGRDDKWVGMTAAAILTYLELKAANIIPDSVEAAYRPRVEKSWRWLLEHTKRGTFPPDGYIRVSGTTSKRPAWNLFWGMCWTVLALLDGDKVFSTGRGTQQG